jgi:hypothetical protein
VAPSAKEQHKPFPLARRSNHGLSGEFANLPSSRATSWLETSVVTQHAKAARVLSRCIVAPSIGAAWQASDVPEWPPVEVATMSHFWCEQLG